MRRHLAAFLFSPTNDTWITLLRLGLGLQFGAYCLSLRDLWRQLLGTAGHGLVGAEVAEALVKIQSPLVPRLSWIVQPLGEAGLSEATSLALVYFACFAVSCTLLLGFFCRASAISAWFLHLCVAKSGGLFAYGVDNLMTIALFYLMLAPFPDRAALDAHLWERAQVRPAFSGFLRRALQLHLCLIYFFSGLAKCLGSGWWDGSNIWHALTRPPFDLLPIDLIAHVHWALPFLAISVWVIEIAYPLFIWPRRTRLLWLTLACLMHAAIGLTMGLYLFALIMIVLNIAAFGPAFGTEESLRQTPPQPLPAT